jgi:hypothetical protein
MNLRTTYILMGVVGLMVAALLIRSFSAKNIPSTKGYVFERLKGLATKPEDVKRLEIDTTSGGGKKLVFERDSKKLWKMIEPVQCRVNPYSLDELARSLLDAQTKTKNVDLKDKKTHNLEKPPVKITLKTASQSATLSVGKIVDETSLAYVLSSDRDDKPLAIDRFVLSSILKLTDGKDEPTDLAARIKGVEDYRTTKLLGDVADPLSQTQSVSIRRGKEEITLSRDEKGVWKFVNPPYGDVEAVDPPGNLPPNAEISTIRKFLNTVYDLQVASAKEFDDAPTDLKKMGITDNPDLIEIKVVKRTVSGEDQTTETVLVGKPVEAQEKQEKEEKLYARVGGESSVAKINAAPVTALLKVLQNPKGLRSRDLVRLNLPRIDAIDIEMGGVTFELRSAGPGNWVLYDPSGNGFLGNGLAVNQLLEALNQQGTISDFPPLDLPEANMGFDPKNRMGEIRLWVDGILPEEKKEPKKEEPKKEEPKKDDSKKEEPKKEEPKKEEPKKEEPKKEKLPTKPKMKGEANIKVTFGLPTGEGVYVRRIDNGAKLDAILPKFLVNFNFKKSYLDFIEPSLKPFLASEITRLSFNRGTELHELVRDGIDWKISLPAANKGRTADGLKINGILSQLSRLRPTRVLTDAPKPEELKTWKVDDDANIMKVSMTAANGNTVHYYFGETVGAEKINIYFRTPEEKFVFELPKLFMDNLAQGDLLDPVVFRIDRTKLKKIRMFGWGDEKNGPVLRELELKDGKWAFKSALDYPLDMDQFENFLSDVLAPRGETFLRGVGIKPEQGLDTSKGALQIDFIVEGREAPISLMLGGPEKDPKLIYARSSEVSDVFTLLKDRFKRLRESPSIFKK